jgi:hypothetical protein
MEGNERIGFLRGADDSDDMGKHPILEMSDEELRLVIGGVDPSTRSSGMTGSYNNSFPLACCDGTQVCCCH